MQTRRSSSAAPPPVAPGHPSRVAIDGVWYTLGGTAHPDYGLPLQGMLDGYAWIKWRDGTQTTADATLLAKYGEGAEPIGRTRQGEITGSLGGQCKRLSRVARVQ